jgi:hypothetical protein
MHMRKIILSVVTILVLLTSSFALAEGDYERGDGWTFQDGELTITDNQGLANFLYYVEVSSDANIKYSVSDVDHVIIGKDVTDIVINDYIYNYNPSNTSVEEGNKSYIIDNGWVVNKETKTLFCAANVKQNQMRSVIDDLPKYIEHIGMYAFSDCSALKEITLPEGVVSIGESCFSNCNSLESIVLPSTVTSIGAIAFNQCTSLNYVSFDSDVKEIGAAAFNACIHLETPPFYNMKLDTIYGNSFWGCDAFQTVEFPPTLRVVENQAFAHSSGLTSLIFNSDQLIIENGAFDACENIRKLVFTQGVPISIGRFLFGEDEKTPDGKSFITRLYDESGKVIPYPTLYYTAAYADEWAPNGETEWNRYSIQQIAQDELNAILAEARGEPAPTPISTPAPAATASPAIAQEPANTAGGAPLVIPLLAGAIVLVVAAVVIVAVRRKKEN